MSFEAELIGFSLALGTNDVVSGERSIVLTLEQFVRVAQSQLHTSTYTDVGCRYYPNIRYTPLHGISLLKLNRRGDKLNNFVVIIYGVKVLLKKF